MQTVESIVKWKQQANHSSPPHHISWVNPDQTRDNKLTAEREKNTHMHDLSCIMRHRQECGEKCGKKMFFSSIETQ